MPGQHVDFRGDGGYIIAPPSRVDTNGRAKTYELIAVAQHAARAVDAVALRSVPRTAPPDPATGGNARAWFATRQARRVGRLAGPRAHATTDCSGLPAGWPRKVTGSTRRPIYSPTRLRARGYLSRKR